MDPVRNLVNLLGTKICRRPFRKKGYVIIHNGPPLPLLLIICILSAEILWKTYLQIKPVNNFPINKSSIVYSSVVLLFTSWASNIDYSLEIPLHSRLLQRNTQSVLEGIRLMDGPIEKALITQFELLNLVPMNIQQRGSNQYPTQQQHQSRGGTSASDTESSRASKSGLTKWRRVGLISGSNVHLDTIVWPGGDIVVSGLSARPRSVFRVVTALAPPFVMESELDEDGLCLRGLPCHRLLPTGESIKR